MTELFLQNGHLSDEGLQALIDGTLDELQRLEAAEHLSFCDECLTRYTALLTGDVLEEPEQTAQAQEPGPLGQLLERIGVVDGGEPARPDNDLGPEHRPANVHQLDDPEEAGPDEPDDTENGGLGQWLSQLINRQEN